MSRTLSSCALSLALFAAIAGRAEAQTFRPERPYRGLFGGGVADAGELLTATLSTGAGFDDNLVAEATGRNRANVGGSVRPRGGSFGLASASLQYSLDRGEFKVSASASSTARYYPTLEEDFLRANAGTFTLSAPLWERASLTAIANAAHQPFWGADLFANLGGSSDEDFFGPAPDLDLASTQVNYFSYGGGATIAQQIARRTSLNGRYAYRKSDRGTDDQDVVHERLGVGIDHGLTLAKGLNLNLGYNYGRRRRANGEHIPLHKINAGVDYQRSLSISRRTTLGFGTGSTITRVRDTNRFILTGSARLDHEFGRSWRSFAAYGRDVRLHETWEEPVLSDGVTGGVAGLLTRRVQFSAQARSAVGKVGLERDRPRFRMYAATANIGYAMTRFLNLGVSYAFYRHRFGEGIVLPNGLPSTFDRHSVRATASLWVPLLQRARRDDVTR